MSVQITQVNPAFKCKMGLQKYSLGTVDGLAGCLEDLSDE